MTVKTIFFDLDDTLLSDEQAVQLAIDRTTAFLVSKYPRVKAQEFELALKNRAVTLFDTYAIYDFTVQIGISPFEALWGEFTDGTLRFPELVAVVKTYRQQVWTMALADVGISDNRLAKLISLMFAVIRIENSVPYEDTYTALEALYERYQLVLLTNGAPSLQQLKLEKAPRLRKYFKKIIISGDFGQGKPAPELFNFALYRAQADKSTSLMVGDQLFTDILGANAVGMKSVWINRKDASQSEVAQPDYTVKSLTEIVGLLEKEDI
ncbi:HAD family hydrolase [Pseudolactococcus yaeyamensis]